MSKSSSAKKRKAESQTVDDATANKAPSRTLTQSVSPLCVAMSWDIKKLSGSMHSIKWTFDYARTLSNQVEQGIIRYFDRNEIPLGRRRVMRGWTPLFNHGQSDFEFCLQASLEAMEMI